MKLLHLGDLHIGKWVNDYSMIEDQKYILDRIIELVSGRNIDAVMIAGDVYDKAVPSEEAVRLFDEFLCRLAKLSVKIFVISGNHDSDERLHFGSALFEQSGIYIGAKYQGEVYKQSISDEFGQVHFYLLPFVKASWVRHFFPEEKIEDYDSAVRVVLEHEGIDKEERNVLLAHQFVAGRSEQIHMAGSENMAVQSAGNVEQIGADCFDDFDYVALGHIHSPQKVGREEVRYCGSPLKYSLSEIGNEKSVPIITLGKKGEVDIELVSLKPLRDMRHLKGRLEQILDRKNVCNTEDYIYVTLTDEDIIPDAMSIIRQYYPNTMKLEYDNAHTRQVQQVDVGSISQIGDFRELISDFYQKMYGCEISEEELVLMKKIAKEAGVADETD